MSRLVRRRKRYTPNKDILVKLEVGDSLLFKNTSTLEVTNRFYNTAVRLGYKLTFNKEDGGVRLTRVN